MYVYIIGEGTYYHLYSMQSKVLLISSSLGNEWNYGNYASHDEAGVSDERKKTLSLTFPLPIMKCDGFSSCKPMQILTYNVRDGTLL